VLVPGPAPPDGQIAGQDWIPPDEVLVSLSVRTAWDLLLSALRLPPGSEIVMSAVTVPDMSRIVAHHGLVPVPVDVVAERLEPVLEQIEDAISPRTRVILVAHLFGTRIAMGPIIELARRHNLLVVEDCAQAYVGPMYAGHPDSDVCLFSFGPIKTATALGGAITRVRNRSLLAEMRRRQREYPVQRRRSYLSRLLKYVGIRLFTTHVVYGAAIRYWRARGVDYDHKIAGLARSFAADRLFELIRRRPCAPLVRMLQRRIARFAGPTAQRLERRTTRSDRVASLCRDRIVGGNNTTHTYWVLPVRIGRVSPVVDMLQQAGFDATRLSSLVVVPSPEAAAPQGLTGNGTPAPAHQLAAWLDETVFLPNGDAMPDAEFERMRAILEQALSIEKRAAAQKREPAERPSVSAAP
jgi:dTDP-4-amino-4,6-dideoxygalactose transaminase